MRVREARRIFLSLARNVPTGDRELNMPHSLRNLIEALSVSISLAFNALVTSS